MAILAEDQALEIALLTPAGKQVEIRSLAPRYDGLDLETLERGLGDFLDVLQAAI
jgi:hypothetical protein